MKQLNLDSEDRKLLKAELGQVILMNLAVLIAGSIIILGFLLILEKAFPGLNRLVAYSVLIIGYFGFFIYNINPRIKELNQGVKGVTAGLITDKKKKDKYAWSGTITDFTTQPKLMEYFFTVDNEDVWIEEKYYDQFNVNDQINIHFSLRSKRIIKITKEENK